MNFKAILVALVATAMCFTTFAETTTNGESKSKVESENKVDGDLDSEITNAKMRAESGSKSKYSASFSAAYYGGTIEDPFSKERKDLLGGDNAEQVEFAADVSGRYRVNKNTSLKAGVGVGVIQPFHSPQRSLDHKNYFDKMEVSNPFVSASTYKRVNNWMLQGGATLTLFTSDVYKSSGYAARPSLTGTALYDFKNGLNVGMFTNLNTNIFNDNASSKSSDFAFGWHPFVEYAFNDMFNFRTIWNFGVAHTRGSIPGRDRWVNTGMRQSFGLGIAASRDVFLYPNFQINSRNFYADYDADDTTVGLSATINMF